jgi:hypothetical protein
VARYGQGGGLPLAQSTGGADEFCCGTTTVVFGAGCEGWSLLQVHAANATAAQKAIAAVIARRMFEPSLALS